MRDRVARHQVERRLAVEFVEAAREYGHSVMPRGQQDVEETADPRPVCRGPDHLGVRRKVRLRQLHAGQVPKQDALRVQRAFRFACGARGIDDDGGIFR